MIWQVRRDEGLNDAIVDRQLFRYGESGGRDMLVERKQSEHKTSHGVELHQAKGSSHPQIRAPDCIGRAKKAALLVVLCFLIIWRYKDSPLLDRWACHYYEILPVGLQEACSPPSDLRDTTLDQNVILVPFALKPLPLGSIKPLGWIRDQMRLMSNGLAGRQYEFYHVIKHSPWLGGHSEYSILNEGLPYWFNGLVPLAYGLNDSRLILQVEDASDYILNHQQLDGWLGPEPVGERDLWARFPLFLGLSQLVEADPSRAAKVIPAMYSFVKLMHSMLVERIGFDQFWGRVRYQDMLISLQWLYENHPEGNEDILLETMYLFLSRGLNWSDWWTNDTFIFADLDTVQPPLIDRSPEFPFVHGVNAAQGLKAGAAIYRFTANMSLLESNRNGVNWTFAYHGDAAGSIIGDEREAGLNANRGSELCAAVETMYSMSYLYQTLGDSYFADRCELAAFNALPVGITGDHWAHQYLTLASQPHTKAIRTRTPFWNVGGYGIIYGLEPNYPCCTVNMPQGLPKYLSAAFVQVNDNGVAHSLLGPTQVSTRTSSNNSITIACDTQYPFSHTLHYNITASAPFTFYLRVPSWYVSADSSIGLGDNGAEYPLEPDLHTGLTPISLPAGVSRVRYTLGANIRVLPRANSTVAVYHGSLLYALDVGQSMTTHAPDTYNISYANGHYPYNSRFPRMPPELHNIAFTNTTPWNIAIDTSTLKFHTTFNVSTDRHLANPIFEYGAPPTYITGKGCQIQWPVYKQLPAALPALSNGIHHRRCIGNMTNIVLRPYGSLKVHMAELPTVNLST